MKNKSQSLKGTNFRVHQNISKYYNKRTCRGQSGSFKFEAEPYVKIAQGIAKIFHEKFYFIKFSQIGLRSKV